LPPYYDVIFIKPTGYQAIPVNGMMLSQETTHSSLSAHTASAGKYLRGADSGQDAGTTGGAYTNTHSIAHGHTGSHSHTGTTTNPQSGGLLGSGSGAASAGSDHTHPTTFVARSDTLSSTPSPSSITNVLAADSSNIEPVYTTLNSYVNDGANPLMVTPGDIAMWLGSEASIPIGWIKCDGNNGTPDMQDQFLKIPSTPAAPSTGGSNTHSHASTSHSHSVTNASHTHTLSATATADQVSIGVGGAGYRSQPYHGHGGTSQTGTVSYGSATATYDSSDNQPPYRTVIYIMCQFVVGGAALFALL
jgi:hypothetical protein